MSKSPIGCLPGGTLSCCIHIILKEAATTVEQSASHKLLPQTLPQALGEII
jgi:hypothetical protein